MSKVKAFQPMILLALARSHEQWIAIESTIKQWLWMKCNIFLHMFRWFIGRTLYSLATTQILHSNLAPFNSCMFIRPVHDFPTVFISSTYSDFLEWNPKNQKFFRTVVLIIFIQNRESSKLMLTGTSDAWPILCAYRSTFGFFGLHSRGPVWEKPSRPMK